jgi:hypothetical protein
LIFAPVMLDLMEGMFEIAGFKRIELGFGFANITDQDLELHLTRAGRASSWTGIVYLLRPA